MLEDEEEDKSDSNCKQSTSIRSKSPDFESQFDDSTNGLIEMAR